MLRKTFTTSVLASFAAALLVGLMSVAQAEVWRIATKQPPDSPEGKAFTRFSELVEKYSNGKIDVKTYPSEQLGKTEAALEQLQKGTITVYPEGPSYLRKWVPEMEFAGAPRLRSARTSTSTCLCLAFACAL